MSELPTKYELTELPRRVRVAYLVRVARRMQPLFELSEDLYEDFPEKWKHTLAVDKAIKLASEYLLTSEHVDDGKNVLISSSAAIEAAAIAGVYASIDPYAAAAAHTAAYNVYAHDDVNLSFAPPAFIKSDVPATRAATVDFKKLKLITSKDVIDLSESGPLGPLWPEGPPDWWDEKVAKMNEILATAREMEQRGEITWDEEEAGSSAGSQDLVIEIEVPEGVSDELVQEKVLWLVDNADEYHRACGGGGLEVAEIELFDEAQVPERSQP